MLKCICTFIMRTVMRLLFLLRYAWIEFEREGWLGGFLDGKWFSEGYQKIVNNNNKTKKKIDRIQYNHKPTIEDHREEYLIVWSATIGI